MTKPRLLWDLPLGTRFRYDEDDGDIFVFLSRAGIQKDIGRRGNGLVAKWDGIDGPRVHQGMYSAIEVGDIFEPSQWDTLHVYPIAGEE